MMELMDWMLTLDRWLDLTDRENPEFVYTL